MWLPFDHQISPVQLRKPTKHLAPSIAASISVVTQGLMRDQ
jgi:hypothetical protein